MKSKDTKIRAYEFSKDIIQFISKFPNKPPFWTISDQLLRSATSIGANLIEARASSSRREFIKFIEIALKSANETTYWLGLIKDSFPTLNQGVDHLISEANELCKMIGSSVITLKGKRDLK